MSQDVGISRRPVFIYTTRVIPTPVPVQPGGEKCGLAATSRKSPATPTRCRRCWRIRRASIQQGTPSVCSSAPCSRRPCRSTPRLKEDNWVLTNLENEPNAVRAMELFFSGCHSFFVKNRQVCFFGAAARRIMGWRQGAGDLHSLRRPNATTISEKLIMRVVDSSGPGWHGMTASIRVSTPPAGAFDQSTTTGRVMHESVLRPIRLGVATC